MLHHLICQSAVLRADKGTRWTASCSMLNVVAQIERLVPCPQTPYQAELARLLTQDLLRDGSEAVSGVHNMMMELRTISNQPLLSRLHVQVLSLRDFLLSHLLHGQALLCCLCLLCHMSASAVSGRERHPECYPSTDGASNCTGSQLACDMLSWCAGQRAQSATRCTSCAAAVRQDGGSGQGAAPSAGPQAQGEQPPYLYCLLQP